MVLSMFVCFSVFNWGAYHGAAARDWGMTGDRRRPENLEE